MENTETLPHELIVEILSWMPIQYLSPLRYVSKTWLELLTTDPHFAKFHYDRLVSSNSNPSILVNRWNSERPFYRRRFSRHSLRPVDFYMATEYNSCHKAIKLNALFDQGINGFTYSIHGICNGLVCLSYYNVKEKEVNVFIWNPLTNDHISIEVPFKPFNFENNDVSFAFGCPQGSDEYKVIKVVSLAIGAWAHVSVYTLGKCSSWRTLEGDMKWSLDTRESSPLVNGILHWLACKSGSANLYDGILALDLNKEGFEVIQLPHDINFKDPYFSTGIKNLGGLLCVYIQSFEEGLQIWAMKEYGVVSSWTKQFNIPGPSMHRLLNDPTPLGIEAVAHNGEFIIEKRYEEELFLYNSKSNSTKKLQQFGFRFTDAYRFIGGLISPWVISGACETRRSPRQDMATESYFLQDKVISSHHGLLVEHAKLDDLQDKDNEATYIEDATPLLQNSMLSMKLCSRLRSWPSCSSVL